MARGLVLLALPWLALALVACADEDLRDAVALAPARTLSPAELAPDLEATAPGAEATGALLVEWPHAGAGARLTALTGRAARSIALIDHATLLLTLSPDGRYAAAVELNATQAADALAVIDLASGRVVGRWRTPSPYAAVWDPSRGRLYAVEDVCPAMAESGTCPSGWRHALSTWAVEGGTAAAVIGDLDFWLTQPTVSSDGSTLYGLGWRSPVGYGISVEGVPFLAAIDLSTGHVRAEAPLPNVLLGQRIEARPDGDFGVSHWPALALAPDGSRAYVAHANDEGITVVDLDRMAVARTSTPRFASSALSRLGGALASRLAARAEAKGGLYFAPQLVVSPDGARLYVTGVGSETCAGRPYFVCVENAPMGLRIVDARSLELLRHIEGISHIALSPDGSMLAGTAVVSDGRGVPDGEPYRQLAAGIVLLHLDDLDSPARVLRAGVAYDSVGFDAVGRIYASAILPPSEADRCLDGCSLLTVLDARGEVLADRPLAGASRLLTR